MSDKGAPLFRVLGALPGDQAFKKSGTDSYKACCPAHEDRHASLSIGTGPDGRVLLNCFAGCSADKIVAALGLNMGDLFEKSAAGNPIRRFNLGKNRFHVREDTPEGKLVHWEANGKRNLNGTRLEDLPLYRADDLTKPGPVVVCEGESCAEALASIGVLAVGTATGAETIPCDASLSVLDGHEVWLWPDNDKPGREHMAKIALRLHSEPLWIDWSAAPPKGDAADYVAAGGQADGIRVMLKKPVAVKDKNAIEIHDMATLQHKVLPEPRWAVPGLFPEGVVLFVGKSKLGKSWFALDVALAVATGAKAWGQIPVEQGEVLYLALEDSERRLSDRMAQIYGDRVWPASFLYSIKFPRANEGGIDIVLEWLDKHANARLVVIDVLGRFRPRESNQQRLYDMDYDAIVPIADVARQRGVCVLILHHSNKLKPDDPIDSVSGTTGLVGAADAICIFRRERGKHDAALLLTGRDIEEQELAFQFVLSEQKGYAWELVGDAAALRISAERQELLDVINTQPGVTPTEVAGAVGRSSTSVRHLLFKMCRDGQVRNYDGKYFPGLLSDRDNRGNGVTPEIKNADLALPPLAARGNGVTLQDVTPVTPVTSITPVTPGGNVKKIGVTPSSVLEAEPVMCSVCGNELWPHEEAIGKHEECR